MYFAWCTFGDSFKDVYFANQTNWTGQIELRQNETGLNRDVRIDVRSLDGHIYIKPDPTLLWKHGKRGEREVDGDVMFAMRDSVSGQEITVMIKRCDPGWLSFTKYRLPRKRVTIGRSDQADIRDTGLLMSNEHGVIVLAQEGYHKYQDSSSNGSYLNGRKLRGNAVRLRFGDVIAYPGGLKLVYLGDSVAVNRTAGLKEIRLSRWEAKEIVRKDDQEVEIPSVYTEFQRSPRMLRLCEAEDVEIEAPIPKQIGNQLPLLLQLGPSMTMIFPMLMGSVFAGRGGTLSSGIVMIATSSVLAVSWGLANRRYRKKQEIQTEETRVGMYRKYVEEMDEKLRSMNEREQRRLMASFPNTASCARMPGAKSRELWNRMPSHPDFMQLRLGLGDVEMPSKIEVPKQKLSLILDDLRNEPDRLKQVYSVMRGAPITIDLRKEAVIGLLGGARAEAFAQGLVMQIATLHSYHDVRIAVLTDEGSASQWEWARWLPHVFTSEDRELRMVASCADDVHEVAGHLDEVMSMRKASPGQDNGDEKDEGEENGTPLPHYVIFCTDYKILEGEVMLRQLLTNRCGMTLVMVGKELTGLPKECRIVLNMQTSAGLMHISSGEVREVEYEYPDKGLVGGFARAMAPLRLRDVAENAAIPTLVSFLDIYGVQRVDELPVWRMWTGNKTYEGLKSTIGYRAGSQPFVLDISDKYHGPHGLIAGTTGSGKSVMLETYILSLALNYSPRAVQFILIDYKGGGMADSFRELPHVAGIIDNLQGERVIERALASLNGEIHRREHIFKDAGVNNINDYARLYGEESGQELPHLIIIVDEFAELKSEQPEFMGELVSASRVGRSLGIHLILATQKPSNSVSDEIWANSRFHLCLRVQTRQDSMEMLKRADAAYIKGMGRCFIQIGNDELFEEVQTSYSGLAYKPNELRAEEVPQMLTPIGRVVRVPKPRGAKSDKNVPTQMDAVLGRIMEVAREHEMAEGHKMWLPELPERLGLGSIELFGAASWDGENYPNPEGGIVYLAGLADDVAKQRYLPYMINITESRNLVFCGLAGTGKTTLVQSIVYSLCSVYDAAHLQIYIMSLTSQVLGKLSSFPQVGDVVFDGEELEIKRLINMLFAEMGRRAELFAGAATDSFVEYNKGCARRGIEGVPAIVIFVDRYQQLRDMFANDDFYTGRINTMLQEGSGRGIHFVVTAMAKNEVPSRLHPFFSGIALQQKDRSDYSDCLGKRVPYNMPAIASNAGRGLGVIDDVIYEVQFGLAGGAPTHKKPGFVPLEDPEKHAINAWLERDDTLAETDLERAEQVVAYAKLLDAQWTGIRPKPIPRIPKEPTWELLMQREDFAKAQQQPFEIPIGYNMVSGELASIDTEEASSWLVYGPRRSGITNFLKLMARVMAQRGAETYIIGDANWSSLAQELGLPLLTTAEAVVDFLKDFLEKYAKPRKPLYDAAKAQGRSASLKQARAFSKFCLIVDNAQWLNEEFSKEANKANLSLVQILLGEIVEKPYYNFTTFMGISSRHKGALFNEPLKKLAAQGRGIALGGKLGDFDPCNVGETLNMRAKGAARDVGHGFVGNNGSLMQIVTPLADQED